MFFIQPVTLLDRIKAAKHIVDVTEEAFEITPEDFALCTEEEQDIVLLAQMAHISAMHEIDACFTALCN